MSASSNMLHDVDDELLLLVAIENGLAQQPRLILDEACLALSIALKKMKLI